MEELETVEKKVFDDIQEYADAIDRIQTGLNSRTQLWADRKKQADLIIKAKSKARLRLICAAIVLVAVVTTVIVYLN